MALDQSKVGTHIAEQMEAIEADFGERDGDYEIGDIVTIIEVRGADGAEVRVRRTVSSPHAYLGLIKFAELQATAEFFGGRGG